MTTELSAREYLRVSFDRSGRERSNDEQHDDNAADAAGRWTLTDPYRDKGSASRYATKARGDFTQLIADLNTDHFDADVLVLWESSRGSRKVGEWVELLDLCETRGVRISVTTHSRLYDPTNPRDRRTLLEDAVDSEYESAKTSVRVRRGTAAGAAARRPHGRRLFGYERLYDPRTGVLVGQRPHPTEAVVVRRIFADYLAGHGLRSIATSLTGLRWGESRVAAVLDNPSYAGRRLWRGEDMGQADPDVWPPLIDPDTFDAVANRRVMVAERMAGSRRSSQGPRSLLLSGVLRCALCNEKMTGRNTARGAPIYQCRGCKRVARLRDRLDDHVTAWVLARLGVLIAGGNVDDVPDPRVSAARQRAKELQAELDDAFEEWQAERLSPQAYARMEQDRLPKIAAAKREAREAVAPLSLDLPDDPSGLEAWWWGLTPEQQREVVMAHVAMVVVSPVGRGRRSYDMADYTAIAGR